MKEKVTRRDFLASGVASVSLASFDKNAKNNIGMGSEMPLRPLGSTGEMVSIMAFGGGSRYATVVETEKEAEQMVHRAIELGINYFDNAYAYGNEQKSLKLYGKYLIPTYRDQIFLTNKSLQRKADEYMREFDESLKHMKTDRIDLMYFHGVDEMKDYKTIMGRGGALKAVRKLVDQKAVRFIGMTGHRNADVFIKAIDEIGLDVIMFPGNAAREQELLQRALPHALKNGVGVMAMKTTAQDKLTGKGGVTAPELVRYAMGLPVSGAVVGMPSMEVLESCCKIARNFKPMSNVENAKIEKQVETAVQDGSLYYLRPDYQDGKVV